MPKKSKKRRYQKNRIYKKPTITIPKGHDFCFFCGQSHPKPTVEIDPETGDEIYVLKEVCVEYKRMVFGVMSQYIINLIIK